MAYTSTPTHGKTARIEKNNVAIHFTDGWTLDTSLDMADVSKQGQQWKEGLPGQGGWSGSMSGFLVLGNTEHKALHDNIIEVLTSSFTPREIRIKLRELEFDEKEAEKIFPL